MINNKDLITNIINNSFKSSKIDDKEKELLIKYISDFFIQKKDAISLCKEAWNRAEMFARGYTRYYGGKKRFAQTKMYIMKKTFFDEKFENEE